jgi:hypothetical protein
MERHISVLNFLSHCRTAEIVEKINKYYRASKNLSEYQIPYRTSEILTDHQNSSRNIKILTEYQKYSQTITNPYRTP